MTVLICKELEMSDELESGEIMDEVTGEQVVPGPQQLPPLFDLPDLQSDVKDPTSTPPTQSAEDAEFSSHSDTEPTCNICGETDWEFSIDHPPHYMSTAFNNEYPDFMVCCDECDVWYHVLCLDMEEHGRQPFDALVDEIQRWPWACPHCLTTSEYSEHSDSEA